MTCLTAQVARLAELSRSTSFTLYEKKAVEVLRCRIRASCPQRPRGRRLKADLAVALSTAPTFHLSSKPSISASTMSGNSRVRQSQSQGQGPSLAVNVKTWIRAQHAVDDVYALSFTRDDENQQCCTATHMRHVQQTLPEECRTARRRLVNYSKYYPGGAPGSQGVFENLLATPPAPCCTPYASTEDSLVPYSIHTSCVCFVYSFTLQAQYA